MRQRTATWLAGALFTLSVPIYTLYWWLSLTRPSPAETCRAMHIAARQGNLAIAQRLPREAAEQYFATVPSAP